MSETGKNQRGDQNPFLNELVVENIAKYLRFQDLKLCRGLNHLWMKTLDKSFLKRSHQITVFFGEEDKTPNFYRSKDVIEVSKYLEIHSDPNHSHPFAPLLRRYRNFQLENHDCSLLDERKRIIQFYVFLHKVGPQMTFLTLEDNQVLRNLQDVVDILSCKYTPNLEQLYALNLKLIDQQTYLERIRFEAKENTNLRRLCLRFEESNRDELRIPWLDVLSRYSNLKALCFNVFPADVLKEIVAALVTIRAGNKTRLNLTDFEYTCVSYAGEKAEAEWREISQLLATANLSLERMFLDDSAGAVTSALLHRYSKTLKSLTIVNQIPQRFPMMQTLTKVTLDGCSDFKFLTNVPNLTSLVLYRANPSAIRVPKTLKNSFALLTQFKSDGMIIWDVAQIKKMFSWMPKIQILEMRLDNKTFLWISQHLPKLKELTVIGRGLDDSGVVGGFGRIPVNEGVRPNITHLRELETFRMLDEARKIDFFLETAGLTEKSVFQGFCLMPKLATLVLTVNSQLSDDAIYALQRRIKDVQIKVLKPMFQFGDMKIG